MKLNISIRRDKADVIYRASALQGESMAAFMLRVSEEKAREILVNHAVASKLSDECL